MEQMTLFGGLDAKVARAMDIIRLGAELSDHYFHRPLIIAYSGGKDSEVIVDLAMKSGANIEIHNNHTTADAPETVYHIRKQFSKWREMGYNCEVVYPTYNGKRISMWELIVKKGILPTLWRRYCCQVLKESNGKNAITATGVRRAESSNRQDRLEFEALGSTKQTAIRKTLEETAEVYQEDLDDSPYGECQFISKAKRGGRLACNPIVDWTEDDVWSYIRNNGIECNPLYEEGFGRVGCVGCPLAGRAKMLRDFERWPKYEKLYRRATEKLYQRLKAEGRDFVLTKKPEVVYAKNSNEMFEWWLHVRK